MTWFRVDDGFSDHAKVHALQDSKHWKGAIALWTLAGSWCAKHEKDGLVPAATVRRLGFVAAEADALVTCGLWGKAEDGYQFHQWQERNPLRAELDAKREQTRNKVTEWRDRNKKPKCNPVTNDHVTGHAEVGNHPVTLPPSQTLPVPDPSRPDPESGRARARPEPVDRLPEPEPEPHGPPSPGHGFKQSRMLALFVAEFEAVQRSTPSLGGKAVDGLFAMVCRTAELQGVAPETLFVASVRAWLGKPLTDREREFPLACFQARWGSLTARGEAAPADGAPRTVQSLRDAAQAALGRGDFEALKRLNREREELERSLDSREVRRAR